MLVLSFKQTLAEVVVRTATTLIFDRLERSGVRLQALQDVTEHPQYGYTASASREPVGPQFVRITDLQAGEIDWASVPFCECTEVEKYRLRTDDILFARTGATTGKTYLVRDHREAVFASYLIRVRPTKSVLSAYLYSFFQSEAYWRQISDQKKGSAQPNVNGTKLSRLMLPMVELSIQSAIVRFVEVVWKRQRGSKHNLPDLPAPLSDLSQIVGRIEAIAEKTHAALQLRATAAEETHVLLSQYEMAVWPESIVKQGKLLSEVTEYLARGRQSEQGISDHYLIKTQHVQMNNYVPSSLTLAPRVAVKVVDEACVREEDILIACSAAGCLGRVAQAKGISAKASTDTHVAIARARQEIILPEYLYAYLSGAQGQYQLRSRERGDWQREKISFRLTELNLVPLKVVTTTTFLFSIASSSIDSP